MLVGLSLHEHLNVCPAGLCLRLKRRVSACVAGFWNHLRPHAHPIILASTTSIHDLHLLGHPINLACTTSDLLLKQVRGQALKGATDSTNPSLTCETDTSKVFPTFMVGGANISTICSSTSRSHISSRSNRESGDESPGAEAQGRCSSRSAYLPSDQL